MQQTPVKLDFTHCQSLNSEELATEAQGARTLLENGSGPGSEFRGWLELPETIQAEIPRLEEVAAELREADSVVLIGIGGSYLGGRAIIEGCCDVENQKPPIYYAGHNLDAAYHQRLREQLSTSRYAINVISKSGTTTEPGVAFRLFFGDLRRRFTGEELSRLVCATTDGNKGALKTLADEYNFKRFVIPDDVGGRFSLFSPVGLLPAAIAGVDIRALVSGAAAMMELLRSNSNFADNPALAYACYRNAAYRSGKKIEILAGYQQATFYLQEWWKQLFGESEGKEERGIFPAAVNLTTDLHSLGQLIQEGERSLFETVLDIEAASGSLLEPEESDLDGLNYLAGRNLHEINRAALLSTMEAHFDGGVPALRLELPRLDPYHLGALCYFFEYSCGISAYMLGVNPFDQPGVEAYKKRMFQRLGKPGYV